MDARLQEMLDHHEIRKLLATYCRGCDRADVPQMASAYVPDSWDDHGRICAPGPQFAAEMTRFVLQETETLSHLLGQSFIAIDGDEAGAETYFLAATLSTDSEGTRWCSQLGGRYVDRLVRRGDGWAIQHRGVIRDWSISHKVETDSFALSKLKDGFRTDADPSYAVLQATHGGLDLV